MTEFVKLLQSSMQFSDNPKRAIKPDVEQVFEKASEYGVDVISFSETTKTNNVYPYVVREAKQRGWWLQKGIRGDCRFALSPKNKIMSSNYVHVLDARGGMTRGNYANRGIAELTFRTLQRNIITVHSTHWLTGFKLDRRPGFENPREALFDRQTDAMIKRVKQNAIGRRLSFWMGDTNVDEGKDTGFDTEAIEYQFRKAGLISIYDELYERGADLPPTHGRSTLDIIGSYNKDDRVRAHDVEIIKRGGRRSDHKMVLGIYSVR